MSFKRFRNQDLIHTTIKTHPEYNFTVHNGKTFFQREKTQKGDISAEALRHVPTGSVSLYELNIDRGHVNIEEDIPPGNYIRLHSRDIVDTRDLISAKSSLRDLSGNELTLNSLHVNSRNLLPAEADLEIKYPLSASIGRIYVPEDTRTTPRYSRVAVAGPNGLKHPIVEGPHENRKYVLALENLINFPDDLQNGNFDSNYKLQKVNIICIPGIFTGSSIKKESIKLNYFVNGKLIATAVDKAGKMICTFATTAALINQVIGDVIYNQGLIILNNSTAIDSTHQENYFSTSATTNPSWLNFGTGIKQTGKELETGLCPASAYSVTFKGTNKIPTLSMFSFSEIGEHNYSNNPTFLDSKLEDNSSLLGEYLLTNSSFEENKKNIKSINKSPYPDHEEDHINTTYISKVGIYDKDKNLIAVATLANPAKKTEKRDFMIKMKIDF